MADRASDSHSHTHTHTHSEPAIVVEGLRKAYRGQWALAGLDLTVPYGTVHADLAGRAAGPVSEVPAATGGAFAAPESMPGWLGAIADWNPMSATATAVRELFGSRGRGGGSWPADHAQLLALCWSLALLAVFFPLAVGRYKGLSR